MSCLWIYVALVVSGVIGYFVGALMAAAKGPDKQLQAENKRLKKFARYVIKQECWSLCGLDGGDIQELAEKLGLIEPHIATEKDIDDDVDYEVGDKIFRFSAALKGE